LAVGGQRLVAGGPRAHDAPQPALDVDRRADASGEAPLASRVARVARGIGIVDPRRSTRPGHERAHVVAPRFQPEADGQGPAGVRSSRAVATFMTPHRRPSTLIGAPTTALKPQWRA